MVVKEKLKKEAKPYLKNIFVVIVVSILLSKKISLAKFLGISNTKISWYFDLGIYVALLMLFLVLLSAMYEEISRKRFHIETYIYHDKNHELDYVKIGPKEEVKVFLHVALKGPEKRMPEKIKISYTDKLDFQIKKKDYVVPDDINNSYFILLNKLVPKQKRIDFEINIPIDVVNSDADYGVTISPEVLDIKLLPHKIVVKDFKFNIKGD